MTPVNSKSVRDVDVETWDAIESRRNVSEIRRRAGDSAGGPWPDPGSTIAIIAPAIRQPQTRDLIRFDLGLATMGAMLTVADLGIGRTHRRRRSGVRPTPAGFRILCLLSLDKVAITSGVAAVPTPAHANRLPT